MGQTNSLGRILTLLATAPAWPSWRMPKPEGLFDGHVLDVVLAVFPALHMRLFGHDEGAQVAAVEHDHVGQTLLGSGTGAQGDFGRGRSVVSHILDM